MGINEDVLEYLKMERRPFSGTTIYENLQKKHSKAAVQKALDYLVQKERILEKKTGRTKVYGFKAEGKFDKTEFEKREQELKTKTNELEKEISDNENILKNLKSQLKKLKSTITTTEAIKRKDQLEKEYNTLKERLDGLSGQILISDDEKKKIRNDQDKMENEWRKRRRMAMNIIDAILESWPKSKKDLLDEIGVETDEDLNLKLPPVRY